MAVESNPLINGAASRPLDVDGAPLSMAADGFSVPHVTTFAAIYSSAYRTYLHERFDEALKKDPQYALQMQRDPHLMGCLQERKLAVVSKKWHLEVDNPKDKWEALVRDGMTTVMDRTPFLRKFMWASLDALWYGKSGVQLKWWWQDLALEPASGMMPDNTVDPIMEQALPELMTPDSTGQGYSPKAKQRALCVQKWKPVHGDKFGHKFDGTPYLLITPWVASQFEEMGYETTLTTRGGYGLVLNHRLRDRFVLHSHELVDEDFFEAEKGEAVFGLGLRDRLFWSWWLRQEYLGWVVDFLERVGLGVTVWYYDASNPTSKTETEKAAKEQSRRSVILCPVWPDRLSGRGTPLIDRLETPTGGAEVLQAMIQTMRDIEQRLINGQDMSSETKATGIGSEGQASFKADTKFQITAYDCENLAESLTGSLECPSLLSTSLKWTYPWCDFPVRWKFNVDTVDPKAKLEAVKMFVTDMGGSVIEDEARALTGMSDPQDDDVTLGGKDQLMASLGIGPDGQPIQNGGDEENGGKPRESGKPGSKGGPPKLNGKMPVVGKFARNEWGETVGKEGDIGHYVTIGGEGGHVVFIVDKRVKEGAPSLKDKPISRLRGGKEWESKASEHGIKADDLHLLAADFLAHHNELGKSRLEMLQAARKTSKQMGYDLRSIVANAQSGKQDETSIKYLDVVAEGLAERYPEHFAGHEDKRQRLYEMLQRGNPEMMKAEQAYEQALQHLVAHKEQELEPFKDQFHRKYDREFESKHPRNKVGEFAEVVDKATLDKHVADGERQAFRGVSKVEHAEQFQTGRLIKGKGTYGNGIYVGYGTEGERTAKEFAGDKGSVHRMAVKKGSVVKHIDEVEDDFNAYRAEKKKSDPEFAKAMSMDGRYGYGLGEFAAERGIDAIDIPNNSYLLVTNPAALRVQKERHSQGDEVEKHSRALSVCAQCGTALESDAERTWCPECAKPKRKRGK